MNFEDSIWDRQMVPQYRDHFPFGKKKCRDHLKLFQYLQQLFNDIFHSDYPYSFYFFSGLWEWVIINLQNICIDVLCPLFAPWGASIRIVHTGGKAFPFVEFSFVFRELLLRGFFTIYVQSYIFNGIWGTPDWMKVIGVREIINNKLCKLWLSEIINSMYSDWLA